MAQNSSIKVNDNKRSSSHFLSIQNLEKIYPNGAKAVYDFNLDVEKNEFIVIVGPSGCGKTTTLRMIAGLEDITAGEIYLEQDFINYKPSKDRKMAIVFQSYALYPQMSVFDNIAFPLTINKYLLPKKAADIEAYDQVTKIIKEYDFAQLNDDFIKAKGEARQAKLQSFETLARRLQISYEASKLLLSYQKTLQETAKNEVLQKISDLRTEADRALTEQKVTLDEQYHIIDETGEVVKEERKLDKYEIREKVFQTAQILNLGDYLGRLPKQLSGGQMQRVALGRAIVKNVPIFLMDEPLSNLDAKLRSTMRSEIVKLHNKINATTIYVTHDQTEAMTMATRIVVMSKGFIQQIAAPQEIYDHPLNLFVAKFIGSPAINLFSGLYAPSTKQIKISKDINLAINAEFQRRHDIFYAHKIKELETIAENYEHDYRAREAFLKILSSSDESSEHFKHKTHGKESLWSKVVRKFRKNKVEEKPQDELLIQLNEKLALLKQAKNGEHRLVLGIRPEQMSIKVRKPGEKYENAHFVTPTVCELLGYEYIVHFDFLGAEMTAKIDAKSKVNVQTELVLTFDINETHFFDPITGEAII